MQYSRGLRFQKSVEVVYGWSIVGSVQFHKYESKVKHYQRRSRCYREIKSVCVQHGGKLSEVPY